MTISPNAESTENGTATASRSSGDQLYRSAKKRGIAFFVLAMGTLATAFTAFVLHNPPSEAQAASETAKSVTTWAAVGLGVAAAGTFAAFRSAVGRMSHRWATLATP